MGLEEGDPQVAVQSVRKTATSQARSSTTPCVGSLTGINSGGGGSEASSPAADLSKMVPGATPYPGAVPRKWPALAGHAGRVADARPVGPVGVQPDAARQAGLPRKTSSCMGMIGGNHGGGCARLCTGRPSVTH